ncbi:DUF3990 domain-containing protein [Phocaeicola faecalis]|uniref:DUF3990 domain-containing protein n=1 Tax=Phocaeicola faecalis TaxID=2786956 RepID=UPI001F2B75C0|nr:DUF3990 domain-containing protein [Phocaeicola faecalis]
MITLYHGTTLQLEHPLANVGREDLDFGKGFYMTELCSQAERWAVRMQLIRNVSQAWVNVYNFDLKDESTSVMAKNQSDSHDVGKYSACYSGTCSWHIL